MAKKSTEVKTEVTFNNKKEAHEFRDQFLNERGMPRKGVKSVTTSYPDAPSTIYKVEVIFR